MLEFGSCDRVLVVGLDCASPWLVFDELAGRLPFLSALRERGVAARLRSCHPPITVPAWRVMASGQDPGQQGVYGFRCRRGDDPPVFSLTTSGDFVAPAVWDDLEVAGLRSTIVGLPGTWPAKPLNGKLVSGLLTPSSREQWTWPPELGRRLMAEFPGYQNDIEGFRDVPVGQLVQEVNEMLDTRFALASSLAADDDWNLFWLVDIGLDRLQHALWHTVDPDHPQYSPTHRYAGALGDYYARLDRHIARLVALTDDGETGVMVVSDHGAVAMRGGLCVNRWLASLGLQSWHDDAPAAFDVDLIDWSRTRAWAHGGYCARLYLHDAADADGLLCDLARVHAPALAETVGYHVAVVPTADLYRQAAGRPPDALVYFDDLGVRAIDAIGEGPLQTAENDRGFDAANHDWDGIFIAAGPSVSTTPDVGQLSITDVAPLVRRWLGVR